MSIRLRRRLLPVLSSVAATVLLIGLALIGPAQASGRSGATSSNITFSTPTVVDPIHTNGEPDIAMDPQGRVFVSGPTGTGTQRSTWFGSVDGGKTFRVISPGPPPSAIAGIIDPPGGGDTDIAFDHTGKQYFTDLYALACLRSATTTDGGATVFQDIFPAGCAGIPGADRQWLAVYDPPAGTPNRSAYTGPKPLIYQEYNDVVFGAEWVKSNADTDTTPGGPGLEYVNATNGGPGTVTGYAPFGADGYPSIDQITGKVFQASLSGANVLLNIGTPDASGNLTFLDFPNGDTSKLITVAHGVPSDAGDSANFVVSSMDSARNLYVAWVGNSTDPSLRQAFVSVASAKSGWTRWSTPVQVSSPPSMVSVFPWVKAGGPGRADVVWYGSDISADPSSDAGQAWDVYMSQAVFPVDSSGAVTGTAPAVTQVKVTPHPMHYNDICLAGTGCIESQGNRNLADFFVVNIDKTGAAEVVYDDTSNGLIQPGFNPGGTQIVDHAGAGVITIARQNGGLGLYGTLVSGAPSAPTSGLADTGNDALYPVIGGSNVPGFDVLRSWLSRPRGASTLTVTMKVADLSDPATTMAAVPGTQYLHYVTRWQMGNTIYYAGFQTDGSTPTFYAGAAQSVDLCSVSACFPHVITYPEPGLGGTAETGSVSCPATPSVSNPCTITINVNAADVGAPSTGSLLEEVGGYAFASSHQQGATTNAQAEADNVPLEIDGVCCYNFKL